MTEKRRILVLCPYPQGVAAGQRLKYEQYFDHWRDDGWEIEVSSFMDRAMWDVVWQPGHHVAKALGVLRGHFRRSRSAWLAAHRPYRWCAIHAQFSGHDKPVF